MRNHLESSVSWSVNPCSHMVQWESLFSAWLYRVKGDVFLLCVVCCSRDDRTEELDGLSGKVAGTNSLPTAKQLLRLCLWSDGGWEGKHTWKPGLMFFSLEMSVVDGVCLPPGLQVLLFFQKVIDFVTEGWTKKGCLDSLWHSVSSRVICVENIAYGF